MVVAGDDEEPLAVLDGELECTFLCDFPGLFVSDFCPGCLTFTPRISCNLHQCNLITVHATISKF